MKRKVPKWNEDTLQLSKQKYNVAHHSTISLAEKQRLLVTLGADNINNRKPLLPEEWVIIRM